MEIRELLYRPLLAIGNLGNYLAGISTMQYSPHDITIDPTEDINVTPRMAYMLSAVSSATSLISGAIAGVNIEVWSKGKKMDNDPIALMINTCPNMNMGKHSFIESVVSQLLLQGNSYVWIERNNFNKVVGLHRFDYGAVRPFMFEGELYYKINSQNKHYLPKALCDYLERSKRNPLDFVLTEFELLNFKNSNFDSLQSPSCLDGCFESIKIASAQEKYVRHHFLGGTHDKIVITRSGAISPEKKKELQDAWIKNHGGIKNKGPIIFDKTAKAERLQSSLKDSQMIEQREFEISNIARAFRVPSHLINQEQKTTSFGSGISTIFDAFLFLTLEPHVNRMSDELNRKLAKNSGKTIKLKADRFNRMSVIDRYAAYEKAIGLGLMTIDDIKQRENLPNI